MSHRGSRASARWAVALAGAFLLASCEDPLLFIQERVPFEPPRPVFTLYWGSVLACSGLPHAEFDRVSWYEIESFAVGADLRARWNSPHDITLRSDSRLDEFVVKHEMLHDLLGGDGEHADAAWAGCGLLVASD